MTAGSLMLSGSTGLVGARLARELQANGWEVRGLSRRSRAAGSAPSAGSNESTSTETGAAIRWFQWDGTHPPESVLRGVEAVVHLAGEPIMGGLPTAARRERMWSSRVDSTRAIVAAIAALPDAERPATFVCASAVGYYGDRGDQELTEEAAPGESFLADLCVAWEEAAAGASRLGVRVVSLRIPIVLAGEGGALPKMALPFRLGLGGRIGSGRQWVSWVHIDDLVALIRFAIERSDAGLEGVVNAAAGSVRNAELTRVLAEVLRRPAFMRVPGFLLRAALGDLAGELLGSHRTVSAAAQRAGFEFRHPELRGALLEELG